MFIDFSAMETQRLEHFKGGEGFVDAEMLFDGSVRILRGRIAPGNSIGWHIHEDSSETIYLLEGRAVVIEEDGEYPLAAGQCSYCPKGHGHSLVNRSDADIVFLGVVPQQ